MTSERAEIDALREYIKKLEAKIGAYELQIDQCVLLVVGLYEKLRALDKDDNQPIIDDLNKILNHLNIISQV